MLIASLFRVHFGMNPFKWIFASENNHSNKSIINEQLFNDLILIILLFYPKTVYSLDLQYKVYIPHCRLFC